MSYDKVLREDADRFVMTVAVVAESEGRSPGEVALEAMQNAQARLSESGALSSGDDE